jgi:hypothetical protein
MNLLYIALDFSETVFFVSTAEGADRPSTEDKEED